MKKLSRLLFLSVAIISCDSDPSPKVSSQATVIINGAEASFTTITATDVGWGIDINMKGNDLELAIQLEGRGPGTYPLASVSKYDVPTYNNSAVVVTRSSGNPLYSLSGNVIITVNDGKISGTLELDAKELIGSTITKISGTFSDLVPGDQSALGCIFEKEVNNDRTTAYRYGLNGNLTERRRLSGDVINQRRIVAYFNNRAVEMVDNGSNAYPIEYSGNKVRKISMIRATGDTVSLRLHEYDGNGRLSKVGTRCITYENGTIEDIDCVNPENPSVIVYSDFDDKKSPYGLLRASLQNQEALIYRLRTFPPDFQDHNLLKFHDGFITTTLSHEYNASDYAIKETATYDYEPDVSITTFEYRNCN